MKKAQDKVSHGREGWFTLAALDGAQAGGGKPPFPTMRLLCLNPIRVYARESAANSRGDEQA
jgi:hypothetical protein